MALTATADPTTVKEIIRLLNMKDTVEFKRSFNRPNLNYRVLDVSGAAPDVDTIVNFIKEHEAKSTGIIYCWHTKECEKLAKLLRDKGLSAMHYHAGVTNREERLDQWKNGTCRIIVATVIIIINKLNTRISLTSLYLDCLWTGYR
jgi:bloom syndrome protein